MMKEMLKRVYRSMPLKKPLFSLVKKVWIPPEPIYRHLHFQDKFRVQVEEGKSFEMYNHHHQLPNEIFWEGIYKSWEQTSLKLWVELVKNANIMLDVGANDGIYSLVSKAVNPNLDIHAFEPSNIFYPYLMENNQINGFDIQCHQIAVSNIDGSNVIPHVWGQEDQIMPTTTLDTFLDKHQIEKVDLAKIDVDWHEIEIAEGFKERFRQDQPTLLIEVLQDYVAQGIEEQLKTQDYGYLYFSIHEKKQTIRRMKDMSRRGDNMNFLICQEPVARQLDLIS